MSDRENQDAWLCFERPTEKAWLDLNGHVNVQFYLHLAALAVFEVMERIVYGGVRPDPVPLVVTLEVKVFYKSELLAGQPLRVYFRPLSRSEKTVSALISIVSVDGDEEVLSSEIEWTGAHLERDPPRVLPLSDLNKNIIDEKIASAESGPYTSPQFGRGFVFPEVPIEKQIVSYEGTIQPEWIDRMGHMGIEHYTFILDQGIEGFVAKLGFATPDLIERGMSLFAVSDHIHYRSELREGEPFYVTTWPAALQRKTVTYRHALWKRADPPVLCATCEHTSVFVDFSTRRATLVPDEFRQKLSELSGCEVPVLT